MPAGKPTARGLAWTRGLDKRSGLSAGWLQEEQSMPVNPELLEILVCPLCKESVVPTPNGDGLKCPRCNRVYPVRDDIPIMLVDEAKVEA